MIAYTPDDMHAADNITDMRIGIPITLLMGRAASALFDALSDHIGKHKKFVILCGKGNNGGDGWALGIKLSEVHENVVCIPITEVPSRGDPYFFYNMYISDGNGKTADVSEAEKELSDADVIVDAVFGTGFSGDIYRDSEFYSVIKYANSTKAFRLAADIPSGADALTGKCACIVFRADVTVTFAKPKIGMYSYPAREFCGKIIIADIGMPEQVFTGFDKKYEITDDDTVRSYIPKRADNSNKGTFGKLLVYAGSRDMTGAAHLALSGALRCGAGLVAFASDAYVTDVMKRRLSEPVFLSVDDSDEDTDRLIDYSAKCSALLIGCGLGNSEKIKKRVERLIRECNCPIILDADGINAVSGNINIITEAGKGILLTPHPLEFSRISGLSLDEVCDNRLFAAAEFARYYKCNILLKGAGTVIAGSNGKVCINPIACSALAKGGSGDVLAGIIASFAAQGASLYESAVTGAYLHGRAGEALAEEYSEYGVLPSDIPACCARILAGLTR